MVEAEDYNRKVSYKGAWKVVKETGLSAVKGIKVPTPIEPFDYQTSSPRLDYIFEVPVDVTCHLWLREKNYSK